MGLIEAAFPAAAVKERDRDEGIPLLATGMAIKGLGQPFDQARILEILVPVLEANDGVEDLAVGLVTGAGPLEMPVVLATTLADEVGGGIGEAGEGFAALAAPRALEGYRLGGGGFRPGKSETQGAFGPVSGKIEG